MSFNLKLSDFHDLCLTFFLHALDLYVRVKFFVERKLINIRLSTYVSVFNQSFLLVNKQSVIPIQLVDHFIFN